MLGKRTRLILLFLTLPLLLSAQASDQLPVPNKHQRAEIFDKLIAEIERVDAIGITTRNRHKTTHWTHLISDLRHRFESVENWQALRDTLADLERGFTNAHSHIEPGPLFPQGKATTTRKRALGFTYPSLEFFTVGEGFNKKVTEGFANYVDTKCAYAHDINCAHQLARESRDNLDQDIRYPGPNKLRFEACESVAERYGKAWQLDYSGYSLCVLSRASTLLIKIKLFASWGQSGMYCGPGARKESACEDIYNALLIRKRKKPEQLILDVQNNRGGSENTPYIAAFATSAFNDLRVEYRKIRELDDAKMRRQLFYFDDAAENWFSKLAKNNIYQSTPYGGYLPARADFCRGSDDCSIAPIKRHALSNSDQKGLILVNGNCISSCDDLVWRLKESNGWKVVGQTPITDGAYARIEGGVFLSKDGLITTQTWGDGEKPATDPARLLVRFRVPVSRTVNQAGELLEGNASVLDVEIAHSREQFFDNDAHLANEAFESLNAASER